MAWDVLLIRFRPGVKDVSQLGSDEQPVSLGSVRVIHNAVNSVFLGTDWSRPHWGTFSSGIGSVEFNVGKEAPVQSLALHIRASDAILNGILTLCERLDCQTLDLSNGNFLDASGDSKRGLQP